MKVRQIVRACLALACAACGTVTTEHGAPGDTPGDGVAHAEELPPQLKLATWNLEWLNHNNGAGPVPRGDADYARLRSYADRLAADVIAFQEVDGSEAAARVFDPSVYTFHVTVDGGSQRTGFAIRKGVPFTVNPDYRALDIGGLRDGADVSVRFAGGSVRLLGVHLKSSCFDAPLTSGKRECSTLAAQLPILESWVDARGSEHAAAIVLGDFNRRLFERPNDAFWHELDDADPPESDLWSPTEGVRAACWNGKYPDFIDHIVFNVPARAFAVSGSFEQCAYDESDAPYAKTLSDHCPLAIVLAPAGSDRVLRAKVKFPARTLGDAGTKAQLTPPHDATKNVRGVIKANIGHGRKLYHAPGCPDYDAVVIDETKGERWFGSEKEALAAGWTRAKNCP